jgi:hypothetical protein
MVTFWLTGYSFHNKSIDKQARISRITQEAELQKFIQSYDKYKSTSPDTVSGSDVIQFIVDNGTRYTYEIQGMTIREPDIATQYNNSGKTPIVIAKDDSQVTNGSKLYKIVRDFYAPKTVTSVTKADNIKNATAYTAVDDALWTQSCLSEYIFGENVFKEFIPHVELMSGNSMTEEERTMDDADEIIDNYSVVKFVFVMKED